MQKVINVLAVLSFVGTAGIVGGGAAVYLNKDSIVENIKSQVAGAAAEAISGALPGMMDSAMPELPSATGGAIPVMPSATGGALSILIMKDLKVPFAIVSFLLVQGAGAVWWASQVDGRVKSLETLSLNLAKENRRYIEQVIQPSYGISSSWKNQYHDEWVLKGGWKD